MTLLDAPPGEWLAVAPLLAADVEVRYEAVADAGRAIDAVARSRFYGGATRNVFVPSPEPVGCTRCGETFRPGDAWLAAHGDRCADCAGDTLFA